MSKFEWQPEKRKPHKYVFDDEHLKAWNEDIVETAGFIPLEVRFKQMEQAGYRARFFESEFTSKDVSDMYLNHPEFDINPEDDIEEMIEKMQLRQNYIESVKVEIRKRNAATDMKMSENEVKANKSESAEKVDDEKNGEKND